MAIQSRSTAEETTDEDLVAGFLAGDTMAMDQLIRRYSPRLRRMLIAMLGSDDAAILDAEQEVFIALVRRIRSFKRQSSFATYFYRLARNRIIDFIRSRKRHGQRFVRLEEPDAAASRFADPESQTLDESRAQLLRLALAGISEEDQLLLYLKDGEDESIATLCKMTGLKPGTIKSRLSRARTKVADALEEMGYEHQN